MKMSITKLTAAVVGLVATAGVASATLLSETWTGSEAIPEGNPVGTVNSLSISDTSNANIQDVSVTLDISGGYNGGLYGYLLYQPSTSASGASSTPAMEVLLNQIGTGPGNVFGSSGSGMDVTLNDSGTVNGSIHGATGVPAGVWQPDSATPLDTTFGGQSADGTWTLFLADLTEGGGTSELVSWGVNISVVPEPITWALIIFGAGMVMVAGVRGWHHYKPNFKEERT